MQGHEPEWLSPPEGLALAEGEVHLWRVSLCLSADRIESLRKSLDEAERRKADSYRFDRHRRRYIAATGALRCLLARYVGAKAAGVQFAYGPHGKPALTGEEALEFNLSHSGDLALCAVARRRALGVDVESLRTIEEAEGIAERFFAPGECAALRELPPPARAETFLRCWTCKEAYLKARGEGLMAPLDGFEVTFAPGEPAMGLRVPGEPQEALRWSLTALSPAPGYVGALVVEGYGWSLRCWEWRG